MGNLIVLHIELNTIRSFLTTVLDASDLEYSKIQDRSNAGEFHHHEDEANTFYTPMMWEEIACRAALGELNALVEWELHNIAITPFSKMGKDLKAKQAKKVSDLQFSKVIELIETYYQIKIN